MVAVAEKADELHKLWSTERRGEKELRRGILHELHELPRGFALSNGPMPTVERPVLGARRRGLPDGNDALLK